MTVNASDHMAFTRLYQNSARVHFDALATGGRPLVYGGLIISIGYAQSFNGLEQRGGIRAINAGTHANPVHSGDTLFSLTKVQDKHELGASEGALRLRLIVVKNERPRNGFEPMVVDRSTKKSRYHPNVVLDLDYWEVVARRGSHAS
jgi:2-methylfumaryl-CoA hydratase